MELDLQAIFVWSKYLERIRASLEVFENTHLIFLINSLTYKNHKEELANKHHFASSVDKEIARINKYIISFNTLLLLSFGAKGPFNKIEKIDRKKIQKIISTHRDFPRDKKGLEGYIGYIMGTDDSASSLARKHTASLITNSYIGTRISIRDFFQSLYNISELFEISKSEEKYISKVVSREIWKSRCCYSIGLRSEASFIIGRILEGLLSKFLLILKENRKLGLSISELKKMDFDTKIKYLNSKFGLFSPSMFSKMMVIKWERNIVGHTTVGSNQSKSDIDAIIRLGINAIKILEKRIYRYSKK